jgi:hypothetical protein
MLRRRVFNGIGQNTISRAGPPLAQEDRRGDGEASYLPQSGPTVDVLVRTEEAGTATKAFTRQYLGMLPLVLAGDGLVTCVRSGVTKIHTV